MARQKNGVFGLFFCGVVLIIMGAVFFFALGKPAVEQGKASHQWPTAEGAIVRSGVKTSSSKGKTMYAADVAYTYTVDDREYESNIVRFGANFSSNKSSGAHGIVREYPVGKTIAVHYNPEEPEVAAIETGAHWLAHAAWWGGLGGMLLGVCMLGTSAVKIILGVGLVAGVAAMAVSESRRSHGNTGNSRDSFQRPNQDEQRRDNEQASDRDAADDDGISLH